MNADALLQLRRRCFPPRCCAAAVAAFQPVVGAARLALLRSPTAWSRPRPVTTSSECQCSAAGLRLFTKPDRPASRIFQQLFTGAPVVTRSLSRFSSPSAPGRGGAFPPRGRGGHTSYKKVVHTAAPMAMSLPPVPARSNRHSYDIDAPSQAQSTPEFIPSMHYNPQGALG